MTEKPTQRVWLTTRQITKNNPGFTASHLRTAVKTGRLPEGIPLGPRLRAWPAEQIAALFTPSV